MEDIKISVETGKMITYALYKECGKSYFAALDKLEESESLLGSQIIELKITPVQIVENAASVAAIKCIDSEGDGYQILRKSNKWFLYFVKSSMGKGSVPYFVTKIGTSSVQEIFRVIRSKMLDPEFVAATMKELWISKYLDKVDELLSKYQPILSEKAADCNKPLKSAEENFGDEMEVAETSIDNSPEKEEDAAEDITDPSAVALQYAAYSVGRFYVLIKERDGEQGYDYAFLEESFDEVDGGIYDDDSININEVSIILILELKESFPELKEETAVRLDYNATIKKAEEAGYSF